MKFLKKIILKINKYIMTLIFFSISVLLQANPSVEKTVSTVSTVAAATVTTTLTMFSKATMVGNMPASGTIRGIPLVTISHNKKDYSDGVYAMAVIYSIKDNLKGVYKINNIKVNITNSSSASAIIDMNGDRFRVEIEDYFADDTNKQAVVEIVGDLIYTTTLGEIGQGMVDASNSIHAINGKATTANLSTPLEVNQAITLNTQPLNFGNVIPLTGKYEKESAIDITGAKGTQVTISLNGAVGQELNGKLESGRNNIPITYRIENGSGSMISDLNLGASGVGNAVLKGIINSDNIPRGQVGGSYTGSVTIDVDYK